MNLNLSFLFGYKREKPPLPFVGWMDGRGKLFYGRREIKAREMMRAQVMINSFVADRGVGIGDFAGNEKHSWR